MSKKADFSIVVQGIKKYGGFYPFSESFSKDQFDVLVGLIEPTDQKAVDLARFILESNRIYKRASEIIFTLFDRLALTKDGLIDLLFGALNRQYLVNSAMVKDTLDSIDGPFEMEGFPFLTVENGAGEPVSLIASQEVLIDATAELIRLSKRWVPGVPLNDGPAIEPEGMTALLEQAWVAANSIANLRDNILSQVLFDQHYIEWTEDRSIRVIGRTKVLDKIRAVGDIRGSYHKHAALHGFRHAFTGFAEKRLELRFGPIHAGRVTLLQQAAEDDRFYVEAQSLLMVYHPHLAKMPLAYFNGLALTDLASVFAILVALFRTYTEPAGDEDPAGNASLRVVWVDHEELVEGIASCVELPVEGIGRLVNSLIVDTSDLYFWRAPFYRVGNRLYFAVGCFAIPNHDLYYDQWISREELSLDFLARAFRDFVVQSLKDEGPGKYPSEVVEDEELMNAAALRHSIVCLLRDRVLVVEAAVFPQPVEHSEHAAVLDLLGAAALRAKDAHAFLVEQHRQLIGERSVLIAVLAGYPSYSGLTMNDVPVIDELLLRSYLISGELTRNAMQMMDGGLRPIASFHYYQNETEFNENLARFLRSPFPVRSIFDNLTLIERSFTLPVSGLVISFEMVARLDQKDIVAGKIELVDQLLTYSYYNEPDKDTETRIDETIQYHFAQLVYRMAFSSYVPQEERWATLHALVRGKQSGDAFLMQYLLQAGFAGQIALVKTGSDFEHFPWGDEVAQLFRRLVESLDSKIELAEFVMPDIFSAVEERLLISFAIDAIGHNAYQYVDEMDVWVLVMYLAILYGFLEKYELQAAFYSGCSNVIELLNNAYHYQKAKDLAEEILFLSVRDGQHAYGWRVLFDCYVQQNNFREAALYGCLFFAALGGGRQVEYSLFKGGIYTLLKFFRNFSYREFFYRLYEQIGQLGFEEIDRIPFDAAFYSVKLQELSVRVDAMEDIYAYIDGHGEAFDRLGTYIVMPWLGLLYNLKRLRIVGLYDTVFNLDAYIERLEQYCEPGTVDGIRAKILGEGGQTKAQFIQYLMNAFETRDPADMTYEIGRLTVPANVLIRQSLADGDLEGVLLSSLVLSDQTFVYKVTAAGKKEPLIKERDSELESRLMHYQDYLLSAIRLLPGQLLVWMFNYDEKEACLFVDSDRRVSAAVLDGAIRRDLRRWTKDISRFHFNAEGLSLSAYDLTVQERDYEDTLALFGKAAVPYTGEFKEMLVCFSTELSAIPHNLLVQGKDFIAADKPVANIISLEYFAGHNERFVIPESFRMSAWIPIDDGNTTIAFGHGLLEEALAKYHATIQTRRYPDKALDGDINVFLAHGIRESAGFKFVRSGDGGDTSIIYPSQIFGSGTIAILFICNSGSAEDDLYSNQIISFSADLLKTGYKAVISSFWPYDVTMCRRWFAVFIDQLVCGATVNWAVFEANRRLAEYNETTSQAFYAPAGRFAMHLYGNPNIVVGEPFP